jgi:hypothetical protein
MTIDSSECHDSAPPSGPAADHFTVKDQIKYLLDFAHERAIAIYIPDSSSEIPERIVIQDTSLTVVGIDDPAVGHIRARPHIPDSIESLSRRSFCHSFIQSLTFGVGGVIRRVDRSYDCSITSLVMPASIEIANEGAFEKCRLLLAIDFSCCIRLREIHGFRGCISIKKIKIAVCVREIGCLAFNNCSGLYNLAFAEGSEVHAVGGFAGSRLTSIPFLDP